MQANRQFKPKPLNLTYQEYQQRGSSIQNMVIDKYVVYDLIGVGSYGCVYRGMDDETKKQVAVKLINMRSIHAQQNQVVKKIKLRLCQTQPKLMFDCDSPFLLKCYDVYENIDLKILIIQFCNGKTLQAQIEQKKKIPENQAWIIIKHIINGLIVLHSHRIIHRDLKAENIMSHNGTYKIIDFGFSKKLTVAQQNTEMRNTSLGTITTMAPEVMSRRPYGLKADIWSIGIIFFQMIYGVYPYDSSSAPQMYRQIQAKKLFNKNELFTYKGHTPSEEVNQFLKFIIVVESDKRPDWRQVAEYPNIKQINTDNLSQKFIKQCQIQDAKTLNLDYKEVLEDDKSSLEFSQKQQMKLVESKKEEKPLLIQTDVKKLEENQNKKGEQEKKVESKEIVKVIEKEKQKEKEKVEQRIPLKRQSLPSTKKKSKFNIQETMKLQQEKKAIQEKQKREQIKQEKQKLIKIDIKPERSNNTQENLPRVRKLNKEDAMLKQKQINRDEQEEYNWTESAHLECLKTQFVFRELIFPLEVLNATDRDSIEFYYLLCARAFNNMSPINDQLEERKRNGRKVDLIRNLSDQIKRLYTQVHKKFIEYSQKLTEKQNKVTSIMSDWFSRKLSKDTYNEKQKFLTGIEKIQYTKQDQIKFTCRLYNEKIRLKVEKAQQTTSILNRLNNYQKIMMISLNQLRNKGINFEDYVRQIVKDKE